MRNGIKPSGAPAGDPPTGGGTGNALKHSKPGVVGATIICRSARYFDFIDPQPSMIDIIDIARGLSNACRFAGQCSEGTPENPTAFYSVAQHSVLVSRTVPEALAFPALMHDAAEAYMGDMVGPLKQLLPAFKTIERRVEAAISRRFGFALPLDPQIKVADLRLLRTEQRDLTAGAGDDWNGLDAYPARAERIVPLLPAAAFDLFLARFAEVAPHG